VIAKDIAAKTSLNEAEAYAIFGYCLSRIKESLFEGFAVVLPSLGTFIVKDSKLLFMASDNFNKVLKDGKGLSRMDIMEKGLKVGTRRRGWDKKFEDL